MKVTSSVLALLTALAAAAPKDAPEPISLSNIAYGGTGCPQGTATITLDAGGLGLRFRNFHVAIGPNTPLDNSRKFCQVNLGIVVPAGYRWAVQKDDFSGAVSLDSGITATLSTDVYFSGSQSGGRYSAKINGPSSGAFATSDAGAGAPWSACGGESAVNVNLAVALVKADGADGNARGAAFARSLNVDFLQSFSLNWERC